MSNNIFINAAVVSFIFLLIKLVEMRFTEKEEKPLKLLVRDTLVVYLSVLCGHFILEQMSPYMSDTEMFGGSGPAQVFTDNPEF
jgi:hypothetical protein